MEKQQKVIHERFQKDYREGGIEIQLNFIVTNDDIEISNIQIHGTFDTGLPSSRTYELENKTFLVSQYTDIAGKRIRERVVGNKYADDIVEQILHMKKELDSESKAV